MRAGLDELRDLFVHLAGIRSPSLEEREMAGAVKDFVRGVGLEAFEDASAALTGCDCGGAPAFVLLIVSVVSCCLPAASSGVAADFVSVG